MLLKWREMRRKRLSCGLTHRRVCDFHEGRAGPCETSLSGGSLSLSIPLFLPLSLSLSLSSSR